MFAPGCCITDIMETPRARNAIIPDEEGWWWGGDKVTLQTKRVWIMKTKHHPFSASCFLIPSAPPALAGWDLSAVFESV